MPNPEDKKPDDDDFVEGPPILLPEGILLGLIRDEERETFVSTMTQGAYNAAGDLASIGILPAVLEDGRAGLYFSFAFKGPDGKVDRVEVGRMVYSDLVSCMAAIVRCLHDADLLKFERGGRHMQHLLDLEAQTLEKKTTAH